MIILIICSIFAFITAGMAQKRGRNIYTGAFFGFFLGIIAVIVYAIMGDTEEKKTERMAEAMKRAGINGTTQ